MGGEGSAYAVPPARRFSETLQELERYRAGDRAACDRLIERLRPQLLAFVIRQIREVSSPAIRARLSAEDIVQNALIVATEKLQSFDCEGAGALLAWLRAIAVRQVSDEMDRLQTQKRSPAREHVRLDGSVSSDGISSDVPYQGAGPRTQAEERERSRLVAEALADLPEQTMLVVMMRVFHGAEWDDIAQAAGIESGEAARKKFARALPALAPRLRSIG